MSVPPALEAVKKALNHRTICRSQWIMALIFIGVLVGESLWIGGMPGSIGYRKWIMTFIFIGVLVDEILWSGMPGSIGYGKWFCGRVTTSKLNGGYGLMLFFTASVAVGYSGIFLGRVA